jgi:hypothetical protein
MKKSPINSSKKPTMTDASFSYGGGQFRLLMPIKIQKYMKMDSTKKYECFIDPISWTSFKVIKVKER